MEWSVKLKMDLDEIKITEYNLKIMNSNILK